MKIANWWAGKSFGPGDYTINLNADFGPGSAYDMRIVLDPVNTGDIVYSHGQLPIQVAHAIVGVERAASFILIPGQYGTAPFKVTDNVKFKYVACAGVFP